MRFRTWLAAASFALAALTAAPASAQDEARLAQARELMASMGIETLLNDFFATMAPVVSGGMAREMLLGPVEEARLGVIVTEEFQAATPRMVDEMARVYAGRMTEEELTQTLTFLHSPAGESFIQTQFRAQSELERIGAAAGMEVGLRAVQRFSAEHAPPQHQP